MEEMKLVIFLICVLVNAKFILSKTLAQDAKDDAHRISELNKLIVVLKQKEQLCKEEDKKVISGEEDKNNDDDDDDDDSSDEKIEQKEQKKRLFSSSFYSLAFGCGRSYFGKEAATMNCILKVIKKKKIPITYTCVYCFVAFISCAKENCAARCSINVCSDGCVECSKRHCEEKIKKCTGYDNLPNPCLKNTKT